jgi:Tol biopolymer transport system component
MGMIFKLLLLTGLFFGAQVQPVEHKNIETIVMTQANAVVQPMKVFLGVWGHERSSDACREYIERIKYCCEWSGRFVVSVHILDALPKKKSAIQNLFKDSYDCAFFITYEGEGKPVEWRLYDTAVGEMIQGKKTQATADMLAGQMLYELTNEPQVFLSKIVYRKKDTKRNVSSLWFTDFNGEHAQKILESRRIVLAPRWCNDTAYPALLFSEFTPSNVRLMMTDLKGRTAPILDVDGTTVGVSYAPCSDDVAYCHSGDIWLYHHDKKTKKGIHSRIIHEDDICACPILLKNGDIIYCSRGTIKRYTSATQQNSLLIGNGYCVAPAYSDVSGKVAYSKKVNGQMQLFVFDVAAGTHTQMTHASSSSSSVDYRSDKTDSFWAPDGIHLVFCWERREQSRIAILNTLTKKYSFITDEKEHCSYPSWSPVFDA